MPSRLSDLQMAQHLGEIGARTEHPLALTDLANRLLRGMPVPLHCGHPPILGDSDPQHADSNQGPTSDAWSAAGATATRPSGRRIRVATRSLVCRVWGVVAGMRKDALSRDEPLSTAVPWISAQVHEPSRRIPSVVHRSPIPWSQLIDRLASDGDGSEQQREAGALSSHGHS